MVPSDFVFMDARPRTPGGKIDRRALRAPDHSRPERHEAPAVPRTPLEATIAGIWAEVLGLENVAIRDDFFDLGGHSLLATMVLSRIRHVLGRDLPLSLFFESPTIEGLARTVEGPREETRLTRASASK
jgi:acyl carrier protein